MELKLEYILEENKLGRNRFLDALKKDYKQKESYRLSFLFYFIV